MDQEQAQQKIVDRALAYKRTFEVDCAKAVLEDLARFCRFDAPIITVARDGHTDVPATFLAEGRREVYLRIHAHINAKLAEQGVVDNGGNDHRTASGTDGAYSAPDAGGVWPD